MIGLKSSGGGAHKVDDRDVRLKKLRRSLFLISSPAVFITFALPLRAEDLGASAVEIGLLYSLFTAAIFVVRPLAGVGLDLAGRKPLFLLAALSYLCANIAYALSENVAGLYAARLLHGFGLAIITITAATMAADITQAGKRSAAMGGNIAAQTRGGMAGGFVAFTLVGVAPALAWTVSFWIFSAVSLAALVFVWRAIPETRPAAIPDMEKQKSDKPPGYIRIFVVIFLAAFAAALIQPFYLIYLRARFDVELYMLAAAFLPMGVAWAILPGVLGRFADRFSRAAVMSSGLVFAGLCYPLAPLTGGFWPVISVFLAAAIGAVLVEITKNAWVADISDDNAMGRAFGLAALAAGAGAALGPVAGGVIYDAYGPDYLFYGAGAVFCASAVIAAALHPAGR